MNEIEVAMNSYRFWGKTFYTYIGYLLLITLWLSSCVNDEINNLPKNILLQQSFSIPLGAKEENIIAPPLSDTSSRPGTYGTFYYNGLPYPNNLLVFPPISDTVNLNLSSKTNISWVKKVTFSILTENSYPGQVSLQLYLVNASGNLLDQVFGNTAQTTPEASVNSNGEMLNPAHKVSEAIYEGSRLELLKQTRYLKYQTIVFTNLFSPMKLSEKTKFKVTIGARVELEYNAKDLNK